jgi:hypothetical protein
MSDQFDKWAELAETNAFFAFVVDGEVAYIHMVDNQLEGIVAACASDPKVIMLENEDKINVQTGWLHDGEKFTNPLEA